jgi:SAM-dependent methyltransferase
MLLTSAFRKTPKESMAPQKDTLITRRLNKGRPLLVNSEYSLAARTRLRRWTLIEERVPDLASLRVLDLGGTGEWWTRSPIRPRHVTAINVFDADKQADGVTMIKGDALRAAELVADQEFDLVFSNSLIEHLGGHGPRREFARLASTLAPRYVVQTPYRYFPVEPHWIFPAFQFLPFRARAYIAPRWPLGHTYRWEDGAASNEVMATELLSMSEMREYFPDAEIVWERLGGVPKSMIAIR